MLLSILKHPATAFIGGVAVTTGALAVILTSCANSNRSQSDVLTYKEELEKNPGATASQEVIDRFSKFLASLGDQEFILDNTSKVYGAEAYLNDTLVTRKGSDAIQEYFLETSKAMSQYQVTVDDVIKSNHDYYFRWTMVFAAPAMDNGKSIHSVGITQVRFQPDGKVAFHQDFWDSGKNFFGHLPVAKGIIGIIRKRIE
ncbi:nuclear transport factor 2 family protein [Luteolibacter pohnpeiensis]|uniref:Nuclear transport factor 2 family protein n=1 Tax=Luteolibacter pohnpeiensis TaxID=454153 RepID=A0A934VQS2_9BACT|nr:nuclear transport factor 2 family protein [Luteolibacter pohnpeiensis]MBK1882411.1 nuclear transport factor 2 family protein [Luteolibacter pohnpeiensis]